MVFVSLFLSQFAVGQNNTNSPYTRFGYGDVTDANSGEQRAMGGVSLGSRSNRRINTINPASYSAVDSMTFMFDLGSSALISRFSTTSGITKKFTANLDYITLQLPLAKNMGFSAGLLPYSFVGYNYATSEHVSGYAVTGSDTTCRKTYTGTGGFSQVYAGLSANLFNHVSIGANAYYMFGTINNQHSLRFLGSSDSTVQYNSISANNFRLRYGVQFYNTFAKKHDVTLGLIYEQKQKLNGSSSQIIDGVLNEITTATAKDSTYEIPTMFGVGLYYTFDKKLSLGLDYTLQQWSNAKNRGVYDLSNRSKIAFGMEYLPNPRGRKFAQRVTYRAGFNLSDSYYQVNSTVPPKNYGVSLGLGLPLYDNAAQTIKMLNLTFEYGKIGSTELLREDFFKFTLNIAFNEHMFFKRKL